MGHDFDRSAESLGNIVELGHVNVTIPDQGLATDFYVTGLGLTRDPFIMTGTNNMWVNVGKSQFHLPTGDPQVVRGTIGLIVPDLEGLIARLEALRTRLAETRFDFAVSADASVVTATCPWGNQFVLQGPNVERFGSMRLGIPFVEFDVPRASAAGIARFYREIMGARADVVGDAARVEVGDRQCFLFVETDHVRDYEGDHVQIYLADFAGPYRRLLERGLITQESGQHQYRFLDIVDLESGAVLTTLDHEVRSMTHPLYGRALVNRDPAVTIRSYRAGRHETLSWTLG
jgi:hypothetical protein